MCCYLVVILLNFTIGVCNIIQNNVAAQETFKRFGRNLTRRHIEAEIAVCGEYDKSDKSPFVVIILLSDSGRFQCLGSILDKYHVLTAKKCLENINIPSLVIVAGFVSPYYGKNSQVRFVDRALSHTVNLAIVKLSKPLQFNSKVQPIRLVGRDGIEADFVKTYSDHKPFMTAGIRLPKAAPRRGDLIPRGLVYSFDDDGSMIDAKSGCPKIFKKQKFEVPKMDEDYNFCTNGTTEFCWTALGSPMVAYIENRAYQLSVVTEAKCRYIAPTTPKSAKPGKADQQLEYLPFVHIRLDWFYKWIEANSLVNS